MYLSFKNPGTVKYEKKFVPGDKAKSLMDVPFTDGTKHSVGQVIEVTEATQAYYNVMWKYYEKVGQGIFI